jgi:hypothetical protein
MSYQIPHFLQQAMDITHFKNKPFSPSFTTETKASKSGTMTGLPDSAREVIVLGAAYRTAFYLDLGRVPAATAEADAQQGNDPVGTAVNIGRAIQALYQQRLLVEVRRLQEQFPPRTHYTS